MLEYTDFGWWQARAEGSAVSLTPDSGGLWPWFSENSTMQEILECLAMENRNTIGLALCAGVSSANVCRCAAINQ
jgi:hypothetical protein